MNLTIKTFRTNIIFNLKLMLNAFYLVFIPSFFMYYGVKVIVFGYPLSSITITTDLLFFICWIIFLCFVITIIYSVKVYKSGIKAYTQKGAVKFCSWNGISKVEFQKFYWPAKYIRLLDEHGKTIIVIPYKGLFNYSEFVGLVKEYAPTNNPLKLFLDQN